MKLLIEIELQPNMEQLLIDKINEYCQDLFNKIPVLKQCDVGRSFAIVRWVGNDHEDVVCINRGVAEAYVEKYNKLSGEQSCYVDDDIYEPLSMA